jgi:penicillin-binding protein 1C
MRIGRSLAENRGSYILAAIVILMVVVVIAWSAIKVRSYASVRKGYQPSDVWIVDRNGYPLESIRTRSEKRSLDWVNWSEVSPAFRDLLVKVEDRRFYSHAGVDPIAASKAAWERMTGQSQRGASTLTMQLVGLISDSSLNRRRSLSQKFSQVWSALKLDSEWTKEEILEAYINLVPFRGELVGLRAASLGYFGKNPSGLLREEAALLVALLRSPNSAPALVAIRTCLILQLANCDSIQNLAQQTISQPYRLARPRELVPVFSRYFTSDDSNSSVIQTSLDYRTQELALRALREQLRTLKNQNVNDGAVLVMETQTGRITAYIANAGAGFASAEQIDGIQTRRQAGSTMKPFVYATAFDWRLLSPGSLLEDSRADISTSHGRVYHPRNYDQIFRGLVSVGDALGSSMNVPAVRALQLVGESRVLDRLRSLGFEQLHEDEYYGPSLALGAIDVTLWELTQGYRQFALEGSTFSGSTRLAIFNILASSEHRRFTFGMDSLLTLPFPAAVKTGTSKDMRDNWCLGWTPQFTVGVWVGNFNGEPMWNVSGLSGAAPIWRNLMLALHPHQGGAQAKYAPPAAPLSRRTISRIRYPAPDMLVGLDPDIPLPLQKLPIEIENPQSGQKLFLNHRLLSSSQETTLWPLRRGKYLVELKAPAGQVIDALNFEVR